MTVAAVMSSLALVEAARDEEGENGDVMWVGAVALMLLGAVYAGQLVINCAGGCIRRLKHVGEKPLDSGISSDYAAVHRNDDSRKRSSRSGLAEGSTSRRMMSRSGSTDDSVSRKMRTRSGSAEAATSKGTRRQSGGRGDESRSMSSQSGSSGSSLSMTSPSGDQRTTMSMTSKPGPCDGTSVVQQPLVAQSSTGVGDAAQLGVQ
eukprot:Skav226373  [mRNA]  locus=scaffold290:208186:208800:+ [translate_table: standard]